MRIFLVFLLFLGFATSSRWYFVCELKQMCDEQPTRPYTLALFDEEGQAILDNYEQFFFDTTKIVPELTENNEVFLDAVYNYLQVNEDNKLTITGLYRLSEASLETDVFENIGIARANRVRQMLTRRGLSEQRITLDYQAFDKEYLDEPLNFQLYTLTDSTLLAKTAFVFENMTFSNDNFEYKSAKFNPGKQFLKYADSVLTFLRLNPDKTLRVIGHTDAIGSDEYNNQLGMERAENARKYFESLGLQAAIKVSSMGKRDSVARNYKTNGSDNPEGRQKNRRVNFVIE